MRLFRFTVAIAGLLAACGTAETVADSEAVATTSVPPTSASVESSSARFFDEDIPLSGLITDWFHSGEVDELFHEADLVFVGTVIDSTQAVLIDNTHPDDPIDIVEEYDGIVFRVDELLSGKLPNNSGQVTIAHPAVMRGGRPELMRHEVPPIGVLKTDIEAVSEGRVASYSYLVFAVYSERSDELLHFFTGAGATRIDGDNESSTRLQEARDCANGDCIEPWSLECSRGDGPICDSPEDLIFDERWVAIVTLECGSEPSKRRISAFDAETADFGIPVLYLIDSQVGSSRFIGQPTVGDEVEVDQLFFKWAIQNVLLGPWDVNEVVDTCEDESP